MARPLFVIGMQRNGTTILTRLLCRHADCGLGRAGYEPFDRWDVPAIGELGGQATATPLLDGAGEYVKNCRKPFAVVRLALPWAWESLAWPRLLDRFPDALAVVTVRNGQDAYRSWRTLPYVQTLGVEQKACHGGQEECAALAWSYQCWAEAVRRSFSEANEKYAGRVTPIEYEHLVCDADGTLAPVWAALGLEPLTGLQGMIRPPVHWSGGNGR